MICRLTGLGSSSSFTGVCSRYAVCLAAHYAQQGQLARPRFMSNRMCFGKAVGCQDQVLAAHGRLYKAAFSQNGDIGHTPIIMRPESSRRFRTISNFISPGFRALRRKSPAADRSHETTTSRAVCHVADGGRGVSILTGGATWCEFGVHAARGLDAQATFDVARITMSHRCVYAAAKAAGPRRKTSGRQRRRICWFATGRIAERIRLALPGLLQVPF